MGNVISLSRSRAERANARLQRDIREAAERVQQSFNEAVAAAALLLKDTPVIRCAQAGKPFYVEFRSAPDLVSLSGEPGQTLCIVEIEWQDEARGRIVTSWAPGYGPAEEGA